MPGASPPDLTHLSALARELAAGLAVRYPSALPHITAILQQLAPCKAGPDFTSVNWYGHPFYFTDPQAAVVEILWRAWESGTPAVKREHLLRAYKGFTTRLADLFRDNPAWGKMIVAGPIKGTYQLNDHIEPAL